MKKVKRLLTLLLSAALICALFSACTTENNSSGTSNSTGTETTDVDVNSDGTVNNPEAVQAKEGYQMFWTLFSGGDGDWMQQMVDAYNATAPAKPVQIVQCVWGDYYTKLMTAVAADAGPDIGVSHASSLPMLVDQGVVQDITSFADAANFDWNDYEPVSQNSITFDGKKYAVPLDTHAEILYYNTDLLKDAGISTESDGSVNLGSNWDEYIAFLETLKNNLPEGVYPISCTNAGDDPYRMWWSFYYQLGGSDIVAADGSCGLDQAIAQQAIEYVKYLYDQQFIAPNVEDHGTFFQAGSAALYTAGTWCVGTLASQEDLNFGCQVQAQLFDQEACWADSHLLTILTGSADPEAAFDFISFVSSKEGVTWAGSGQIPSSISIKKTSEYTALEYQPKYSAAAEIAVLPSQTPHFNQIKTSIIEQLDLCWTGEQDAAATAAALVNAITTALS